MSAPYTLNAVSYGTKRNKHPKVWEIYPDDLEDYLIHGGVNDVEGLLEQEELTKRVGAELRASTSSEMAFPSSTTSVTSRTPRVPDPAPSDTLPLFADKASSTASFSRHHSRESSVEALNLSHSQSVTRVNSTNNTDVPCQPYRPSSLGSGFARSSTSARVSLKAPSIISSIEPVLTSSSSNTIASNDRILRPATPLNDLVEVPAPVATPATTTPLQPVIAISPQRPPAPLSVKSTPSEGLRHTLSKRIDKIRGRNDEGILSRGNNGHAIDFAMGTITGMLLDQSDIEGKSSATGTGIGANTIGLLKSPVVLHRSSKKGRVSLPEEGKSSQVSSPRIGSVHDKNRSSGDELPPMRRRRRVRHAIWATVTSGFRGPIEPLVVTTDLSDLQALRRRRMMLAAEESDEEEVKVPRQVWDLDDEEFERLTECVFRSHPRSLYF